jgi:hypothetical protein
MMMSAICGSSDTMTVVSLTTNSPTASTGGAIVTFSYTLEEEDTTLAVSAAVLIKTFIFISSTTLEYKSLNRVDKYPLPV